MLRQEPHPALHAWMDELSKMLGWGHRLLRHSAEMMDRAQDIYGEEGAREVALHIACDMGVVTKADLWR